MKQLTRNEIIELIELELDKYLRWKLERYLCIDSTFGEEVLQALEKAGVLKLVESDNFTDDTISKYDMRQFTP